MIVRTLSPMREMKTRGTPLSEQQEAVLRLVEKEKLTHAEVALRLGTSKARIQQISRTAKAIREDYAQNGLDALSLLPGRARNLLVILGLASRVRVKLAIVRRELFWDKQRQEVIYKGYSPRNMGWECWRVLLEWATDDWATPHESAGREQLPAELTAEQRALLKAFAAEVNRRAEANMLKTGKLEGSHHAAMRELLKKLGCE
jgi:ParB-like chromosome segregation protein Spo0J